MTLQLTHCMLGNIGGHFEMSSAAEMTQHFAKTHISYFEEILMWLQIVWLSDQAPHCGA